LWTAYYLKRLDPGLSICVLEAEVSGYGASGRNGGWMMAALEGEQALLQRLDGDRQGVVRRAIHSILPEVERVLEVEQIDCDYYRGGGLFAAARYPEQLPQQQAHLAELREAGFGDNDYSWLDAAVLGERLRIARPLGAIYTPHIARIHPGKLVRGLARAARDAGVEVFERTRARALTAGAIDTDRGRVRAPWRVLAVEGFNEDFKAQRRYVLPIQSRIIATEPLPPAAWDELGLARYEVFCDASPQITYGQRTADDRLVFGARGAYRFGGRPRSDFSADNRAFRGVHRLMLEFFPQLAGAGISHRWGGTLGVPRGSSPHVVMDAGAGLALIGGYTGEGVGAANLMARTLADALLQRDSDLAGMPWLHRAGPAEVLRRWEPEPLRWLGYKTIDMALSLEETVYRARTPAWLRRAGGRGSALVQRLLD
jgi:glycine/D-amino acid oxidase-like deaminating enzyme